MTFMPGISQPHSIANQTVSNNEDHKHTLGQKEFLTLLVAQMQHQDPLNPTESTEWTAQLAQYSQLEQFINMNKTMELLVAGQHNAERLAALSLLGKQVLVEGATFSFAGQPVDLGYRVNGEANSIEMLIKNSSGKVVANIIPSEKGTGNHFVTWDGLDQNGQTLPEGKYSIMINTQGVGEEGETEIVVPLVRSAVNGVDLGEGGAVLLTSTGNFPLSAIYGVFDTGPGIK